MEEENATHAKRSGAYAAVSAVLSLIGLLGLFLGYFTDGSTAGYAIAGGAPILKGSLWGVTVEILRGSIGIPTVNAASGLAGVLPFAL